MLLTDGGHIVMCRTVSPVLFARHRYTNFEPGTFHSALYFLEMLQALRLMGRARVCSTFYACVYAKIIAQTQHTRKLFQVKNFSFLLWCLALFFSDATEKV